MKTLIARIFGLYTKADRQRRDDQIREERRDYYQKVLDNLHRTGSLMPNCDLKMPKATLVMSKMELTGEGRLISTGEVIAADGRWKRLPADGEIVKVTYAKP